MPFSHHSHSGEFCAHAKNTLSEMIEMAREKQMLLFALTEHVPRIEQDLYPEEREIGLTAAKLVDRFAAYVDEAHRLRQKNSELVSRSKTEEQMSILVGFEAEWIRPEESADLVHELLDKYRFDYFVGSVHHVRTIPIDFGNEAYLKARQACGGTDDQLFADYFDSQYQMLQTLKPKIVGHFDLIRLLSDQPNLDWTECSNGEIWPKIIRNLKYIANYGGLVEINTSAWRKGLHEPYPTSKICQAFIEIGGSFVLSDDSHAIEHVATNFDRLPGFFQQIGLEEISYLCKQDGSIATASMPIRDLLSHPFWRTS